MVDGGEIRSLACALEGESFFPPGVRRVRARMVTNCMFPLIPAGAVLVIEPAGRLRPGDVVLFRREGHWYCHRLVRVDGELVTTWADRLLEADAPLRREQIEGRCVLVARRGRAFDLDWPLFAALGRAFVVVLPPLKGLWRRLRGRTIP